MNVAMENYFMFRLEKSQKQSIDSIYVTCEFARNDFGLRIWNAAYIFIIFTKIKFFFDLTNFNNSNNVPFVSNLRDSSYKIRLKKI